MWSNRSAANAAATLEGENGSDRRPCQENMLIMQGLYLLQQEWSSDTT